MTTSTSSSLAVRQASSNKLRANFVSSEYFPVLRIPLLQGRLWDHQEIARGARLAVINQTMARQVLAPWRRARQATASARCEKPAALHAAVPDSNNWLQIIGVVADARDDGLRKPIKPAVYVPYTLQMQVWTQILVRSRTAPLALLNRVRAQVKAVDPDQQVFGQTRDLEQWIEGEDEYAYGRLVAGAVQRILPPGAGARRDRTFQRCLLRRGATNERVWHPHGAGSHAAPRCLALVFTTTFQKVAGGLACGLLLSFVIQRHSVQVCRRQLVQSAGHWRGRPAAGSDFGFGRLYSRAASFVGRADGCSAI